MNAATSYRSLLAEIAGPLLLVFTLETAFGVYLQANLATFPLPRFMKTAIDSGKYLAFRDVEEKRGDLDVVFLGISPMMRVSGEYLQAYAAEHWNRDLRSFNFAAPFHSVELDRRLLKEIVFPVQKPATVVYGFTPISMLHEPSAAQVDAAVSTMVAFRLQGGGPATWLRDELLRKVKLLEYREVLRDRLARVPEKPDPWIERARATDAFGDLPLLEQKAPVRGVSRWEQKYVRRFASFDRKLADTLLFEHLRDLAELCRDNGVHLVVLLNAVHPFFLDMLPDGRRDFDEFTARLRKTAREAGVPFFDPSDGGIGRPELFQDTHHHNRAGTEWLTGQVARYLVDHDLLSPRSDDAQPRSSTTG